jgi:hypothetical protein
MNWIIYFGAQVEAVKITEKSLQEHLMKTAQ